MNPDTPAIRDMMWDILVCFDGDTQTEVMASLFATWLANFRGTPWKSKEERIKILMGMYTAIGMDVRLGLEEYL